MMDPYLPHGISSCGILYSGFHTTFIDPASENPFLTSLKQSGVGRGICSLPVIKQAFAFDADLARRDAIFPAMRQDAENRRMAFIAPLPPPPARFFSVRPRMNIYFLAVYFIFHLF